MLAFYRLSILAYAVHLDGEHHADKIALISQSARREYKFQFASSDH